MGGIRLTSNSDMCTSALNPIHINGLDTISIEHIPNLQFNANEKDELESVEFKQNGYSSDFTYTIPKGAKHYVVNELPTTDIDTAGNYYVMTESEDGRSFLSTDIHNLTTTEFPVRVGGESRSNAVVNATGYTILSSVYVSVGEYRGSLAIRFNIPCAVTVTLNPRPSSSSGPGRFGFMNLYKNNYNNHLLLTNAGEVGTVSQNFAKDEILCIDCSGYTSQFYYKLAIQPYTIDGKIPLSTNVDEYINYENIWFKNGSRKLYQHSIKMIGTGATVGDRLVILNMMSYSSQPKTWNDVINYCANLKQATGSVTVGGVDYGVYAVQSQLDASPVRLEVFYRTNYLNSVVLPEPYSLTDTITEVE